jgi:hypothetical protein
MQTHMIGASCGDLQNSSYCGPCQSRSSLRLGTYLSKKFGAMHNTWFQSVKIHWRKAFGRIDRKRTWGYIEHIEVAGDQSVYDGSRWE